MAVTYRSPYSMLLYSNSQLVTFWLFVITTVCCIPLLIQPVSAGSSTCDIGEVENSASVCVPCILYCKEKGKLPSHSCGTSTNHWRDEGLCGWCAALFYSTGHEGIQEDNLDELHCKNCTNPSDHERCRSMSVEPIDADRNASEFGPLPVNNNITTHCDCEEQQHTIKTQEMWIYILIVVAVVVLAVLVSLAILYCMWRRRNATAEVSSPEEGIRLQTQDGPTDRNANGTQQNGCS